MKGAWFARVCNQLVSHWHGHHFGGAGRRIGRRAHRSSRSIRLEHLEARQLLSIDLISAPHPDLAALTGNGSSSVPSLSADGRYVAFESDANNLVPGDTNGITDVFVRDLWTGITTRVSTDSEGNQANRESSSASISADGRFVAFRSAANNLVAGDTNFTSDVFVKDLQTGITTRVSTDSMGSQAKHGGSYTPAISANGRYVAFVSCSNNLVPDGGNAGYGVFVKDLQTGRTMRVSTDSEGNKANRDCSAPDLDVHSQYVSTPLAISADGRYVAFESDATNLVPGDTNGQRDIFVKDLQTGLTIRANTDDNGNQATIRCDRPSLSADGRYCGGPGLTDSRRGRDNGSPQRSR